MRRFLAAGILAVFTLFLPRISQRAWCASVITGYVQTQPNGVQPGNPNVTSVTAGQMTDTSLSVGCVQAAPGGQLTSTGINCGTGSGGGGGSGTINPSVQYSQCFYSFTGSSNVVSGLAPGTSGYFLVSGGSSSPPFWESASANGITPSPQFEFPYYSTFGTNTTLTGDSGFFTNGAGQLSAQKLFAATSVTSAQLTDTGLPNAPFLSTDSGGNLVSATLPTDVAYLDVNQTFTGANIFNGGSNSFNNPASGGTALTVSESGIGAQTGMNVNMSVPGGNTGTSSVGISVNNNANYPYSGTATGYNCNISPLTGSAFGATMGASANAPYSSVGVSANASGTGPNTGLQVSAIGGTLNHAVNIISGDLAMFNSAGTSSYVLISRGQGLVPFWGPISAAGLIALQNTLQSGATFFVSSGTVQGNLTATNIFIPGISNGQCLQSGPGGQVFGTGFACGGGAGAVIQNQSTLQAGATAYPDFVYVGTSETVNGTLTVGQSGLGNINIIPGFSANSINSSSKLTFGYGNGNYGANFGVVNLISAAGTIHPPWFTPGAVIVGSTFVFTGPQESTVTYGLAVGSITIGNITSGIQCLHADTNGNVTGTGADCGAGGSTGGGVSGSTFTFIGPTQSTITYGVTVGSLTITGIQGQAGSWIATEGTTPAGTAGAITLTADTTGPALKEIVGGGATYYVATSSVAAVQNDVVGWGPLGQLVDIGPYPTGAPGGPTGSLQLNAGGGLFTGSPAYVVSGGSLTIISSVSVTNAGGRTNGSQAAYFDVFHSTAFSGQYLFSVGSENNGHQFTVQDQKPVGMGLYGATAGLLGLGQSGVAGSQVIWNTGISQSQEIDMGTNGPMIFKTTTPGSSGGDIFIVPEVSTVARFGSTGIAITSSMTITAPATAAYDMTISSSNSIYHVAISTTGHFISNGPTPSISGCGSTPNGSVVGDDTTGTITIGGGSVTGCTLTFFRTWGTGCTVNCVISDNITTATPDVTSSISGMTLGFSASIGGGSVTYVCTGYGPTCQ